MEGQLWAGAHRMSTQPTGDSSAACAKAGRLYYCLRQARPGEDVTVECRGEGSTSLRSPDVMGNIAVAEGRKEFTVMNVFLM